MFKQFIWPIFILISLVMTIVFVLGFVSVIRVTRDGDASISMEYESESEEIVDRPSTQEVEVLPPSEKEKIILIIGDSIGAGVGDEENLGMGNRYVSVQPFEEKDAYEVVNFSVPGAETGNLLEQILSEDIDGAIEAAQFIIVSIGGNNLNRIRNTDRTMQSFKFEETLREHLKDVEDVLNYIRKHNASAKILMLGLYNPFGDSIEVESLRMIHEWNYQTRLKVMETDNTNMIPLYDLFEENLDQLLSIDQFHPSGAGYEAIAEMIDRIINKSD